MRAYQKERLHNVICFFAREHLKHTKRNLYQTYLFKYLALFDFELLEETGRAPLDLDYRAMERGPVPVTLYGELESIESDLFHTRREEGNRIIIQSKRSPDLSYFSDNELGKMKNLVYIYATRWITADDISEGSHQKILAWRRAWTRKPNSMIDKADTFKQIQEKSEEELTPEEERFLVHRAIRNMGG